MEIVLNRKGGVPLRDQLVAQLEMRLLGGDIPPGGKLPSVRALGRRLRLHANTVSAAYRRLEASGHVEMRRGAGVFVRPTGASSLEGARDLDEMIQIALAAARQKGFSARAIRVAVERWLAAPSLSKVVVVDKSRHMAELLAAEVRAVVSLKVAARGLAELDPVFLDGALTVSLPYYVAALRRTAPRAVVFSVTLANDEAVRKAMAALEKGGIVLVISHSETVLPFADKLIRSLRGDELLVETRTLRDRRDWKGLLPAADLVIADALSVAAVRRIRTRGVLPFRLLGTEVLERLARAARSAIAAFGALASDGSPKPPRGRPRRP